MANVEALLLINPLAGKGKFLQENITCVQENLLAGGISTELITTQEVDHFGGRLRGKDLLIVWGGDGTIHQILPSIVSAKIPLGIIPAGTANVLAKELGLSDSVKSAVDVLVGGRTRSIYLGKANGQYFHLMAGVGADGFIISQVGSTLKRTLGVMAFWLTGLSRFWAYPLRSFEVSVGDTVYPATFAVVSNSRLYGRHLSLAPKASIFEEGLDLCLFRAENHFRFLQYLWGVIRGNHLSFPDVIYTRVDRVQVRGSETIPVQLDGELAGFLPRDVALAEETIQVIAA